MSTLLYYYFTTLLKPHLCPDGAVAPLPRALNAPFPDFSYHYYSAFRIHHVFLHHHCPSHTNSVESQDNQSTALFDMRHLNNRTIFLHLCVFVVPLSCHKRLLLHWAMILNPLLIYVAASYTLVLTLIFSPNVFLYSYLSPRRGYTIGDGWGCIPPHQPYPKKLQPCSLFAGH